MTLISVEFSLLQHSRAEPYQASLYHLADCLGNIFCGCQPRRQICSIVRQTAIKKINGDPVGTSICDSYIGRLYYSCRCIYLSSSTSTRVIYTNLTINVTATTALCAAIIVLFRQIRVHSQYSKTFGFLVVGLGLWFTAEII